MVLGLSGAVWAKRPAPRFRRTPTPTPVATITPAPTIPSLQWGAYVGDSATDLANFEGLVGRPVNIQATFTGWQDSFPDSSITNNVGPRGKTLLIFWESTGYTEAQMTNGSLDSYITLFADQARAYGYPVILAPWPEMNGDWNDWGGTVGADSAQGFIAMWQHVHNIFTATGETNVKWAWDVNNESYPSTPGNAAAVYWPGSSYVDYVAVDGFNFGSNSSSSQWRTFAQVFPPSLMTQLASYNKPLYILSTGAMAGPDKASWITDGFGTRSATFIKNYPLVSGWVWFNQNGADGNWLVNSDPNSLTAFRQAIP